MSKDTIRRWQGFLTGVMFLLFCAELHAVTGQDDFRDRPRIGGPAGVTRCTTERATKERGEPDHAGDSGGASLWWEWRAPLDGVATFRCAGSSFPALLAVHEGSSVRRLRPVAADAAPRPGEWSQAAFPVEANARYQIAVDGRKGLTGPVVLSWSMQDPEGREVDAEAWWRKIEALAEVDPGPKPNTTYGSDNRRDVYQVTDPSVLQAVRSTVALIAIEDLQASGDGSYSTSGPKYGEEQELCTSEAFWNQPSVSSCSGFLVAPDLVVTAGHCLEDRVECGEFAFVFGYEMLDSTTPRLAFPASDVYFCRDIVGRYFVEEEDSGSDWCVVRLDREVEDREPFQVRKSGRVADRTSVIGIHYPSGIPCKVSNDVTVQDNTDPIWFSMNADASHGSSGSAVLDASSFVVEGILVRGPGWEWAYNEILDCYTMNRCPQNGGSADEDCNLVEATRSTEFSQLIPEIAVCKPISGLDVCQSLFGQEPEDNSIEVTWTNGDAGYLGLHIVFDGFPWDPIPGHLEGIFVVDLPLGEHRIEIQGDCGGALGMSRSVSLVFDVVAEPPAAMLPEALVCRFTSSDYSRATLTWKNTGTADYIEVYAIDPSDTARLLLTVAGQATGANVEGTARDDRLGILAHFSESGACFAGQFVLCTPTLPPGNKYQTGDCDGSANYDLTDAIFSLDYLFRGGNGPPCEEACNTNRDNIFDLSDPIYTLNHLFLGGPQPPGKYPKCEEGYPEGDPSCAVATCKG